MVSFLNISIFYLLVHLKKYLLINVLIITTIWHQIHPITDIFKLNTFINFTCCPFIYFPQGHYSSKPMERVKKKVFLLSNGLLQHLWLVIFSIFFDTLRFHNFRYRSQILSYSKKPCIVVRVTNVIFLKGCCVILNSGNKTSCFYQSFMNSISLNSWKQ